MNDNDMLQKIPSDAEYELKLEDAVKDEDAVAPEIEEAIKNVEINDRRFGETAAVAIITTFLAIIFSTFIVMILAWIAPRMHAWSENRGNATEGIRRSQSAPFFGTAICEAQVIESNPEYGFWVYEFTPTTSCGFLECPLTGLNEDGYHEIVFANLSVGKTYRARVWFAPKDVENATWADRYDAALTPGETWIVWTELIGDEQSVVNNKH